MAELLTRFARVVRTSPERIAVRDADSALTFAELGTRTSELAAVLRERGIRGGERIGVCLPRRAGLLVALLAVWRAGAAYVPLDPGYPDERLASMSGGAGLAALIHDGPRRAWMPDCELVGVTARKGGARTEAVGGAGSELAYVIYTSGSSGAPKGVLITHSCVASLVAALEAAGVYAPEPRTVAWNASVSFDASVQQWVRVCRGDTIIVLDEADRTNSARLRELLDSHRVTDLDLTPTHWEVLREDLLPAPEDGRVLKLIMGGEPVPERTWREIATAGGVEGVNVYGPTECTVDAMVAPMIGDHPHLGRPLPGNTVYVLGDDLVSVRPGQCGELYIAGPQVGLGYLGSPALTARRFLPDPLGHGSRMYRTGDLVELSRTGGYTFVGRADRQVKWLGVRIEPGEIEYHLRAHPAVTSAAVVVQGQRLVAYVVLTGDEPAPADLLRYLSARLPAVMVPSKVVPLDALPLTLNGKLDLAALATPTAGHRLARRA